MSVNLAPGPFGAGGQFVNGNNQPLNGGLIYTYAAGTTTPQATFTTSAGSVQNANPITLSATGICPAEIWLTAGQAYKFVVTDSLGNPIYPYVIDNLLGINDFSNFPASTEWIATGLTPTFVNTTSFTLVGDQTAIFTTNRRVRLVETAGTVYGVVTSSSVSLGITTINVTIDASGVVDSGISAVAYGILNAINPSIPQYIVAGARITVTYTNGVPTIAGTINTIVPRSYLAGCALSTAGGSANMSIAAGQAVDSTNVLSIPVVAITKTTSAWVAGTNAGGLDTGAISTTTWYHFYVISNASGSLVDVIFTLSASTPALPTGYTLFRYIGSGLTDGSSHWLAFTQAGDLFEWSVPVLETTSAAPGTNAVTQTLANVPTGVNVRAIINATHQATQLTYFSDLATTDAAPAATTAPLFNAGTTGTGSNFPAVQNTIRTNTSAQIRYRTSNNSQVYIATIGWFDRRGQDN